MAALAKIPVIDVRDAREPGLATFRVDPSRLDALLMSGRKTYTAPGLRIADALSRIWAERNVSPYAGEVAALAATLGRPGAYLLNYSYEWGCTTGACEDPENGGVTLLRTLDWPFDGLGRNVVVALQRGEAGDFANVTWPGFAGVLTALAPGRFAAAINQPPLRHTPFGKPADWFLTRLVVSRNSAMPATHLLRRVFERCRTFEEARHMIESTPISLPAIFSLAGKEAGQALVIERTETAAYVASEPAAANHWAAAVRQGRPRHPSSEPRRRAMSDLLSVNRRGSADWDFSWLTPPILQDDTRLAFAANPRNGRMSLEGWESDGRATERLTLDLPALLARAS